MMKSRKLAARAVRFGAIVGLSILCGTVSRASVSSTVSQSGGTSTREVAGPSAALLLAESEWDDENVPVRDTHTTTTTTTYEYDDNGNMASKSTTHGSGEADEYDDNDRGFDEPVALPDEPVSIPDPPVSLPNDSN